MFWANGNLYTECFLCFYHPKLRLSTLLIQLCPITCFWEYPHEYEMSLWTFQNSSLACMLNKKINGQWRLYVIGVCLKGFPLFYMDIFLCKICQTKMSKSKCWKIQMKSLDVKVSKCCLKCSPEMRIFLQPSTFVFIFFRYINDSQWKKNH